MRASAFLAIFATVAAAAQADDSTTAVDASLTTSETSTGVETTPAADSPVTIPGNSTMPIGTGASTTAVLSSGFVSNSTITTKTSSAAVTSVTETETATTDSTEETSSSTPTPATNENGAEVRAPWNIAFVGVAGLAVAMF